MTGSSACGPGAPAAIQSAEQTIIGRADLQFLAAAVRHGQRRLEQHEALVRLDAVDAPAERLPGQDEMIGLGVVAAQRQLQAALAGQGAVTRAGVAADPRHHRNDVVAETPVDGFLRADHLDLRRRLLAVHRRGDRGFAVADRAHRAAVHHGHGGIGGGEGRLRGLVADDGAAFLGRDEQALGGVRAGQRDVAGEDLEVGGGRGSRGQERTGEQNPDP